MIIWRWDFERLLTGEMATSSSLELDADQPFRKKATKKDVPRVRDPSRVEYIHAP